MSITSIKYHPISKTQLRPPLAPSGTCGASSLPEGAVFPLAFAFSHWIFGNRKCLLWNPSVKNQRFLPAPFGKGAFGVHRRSPPLPKGGASAPPRRGDSVAKATDFFPIPSSLFTKKPSPFHMGLCFRKVPTVNPSVKNQRFLPAPTGREPLRAVPADNFAR